MRASCVNPVLHLNVCDGQFFITSSDYKFDLSGPFPDKETATVALDAMNTGINLQRNAQLTELSVQIAQVAAGLQHASSNGQKSEVTVLSERLYTLEGCFAMIAGISKDGPAFQQLVKGMQITAGVHPQHRMAS